MIVKTLLENTSISNDFETEHGLSMFLKTKKHNILFDLGQTDNFYKNALKLDVSIKDIDIVIISHGHYDHGGGLKTFLELNNHATIYVNENAFNDYYSRRQNEMVYIGLDKSFKDNKQIVFVGDEFQIDDELFLYSNVKGKKYFPKGNKNLYKKIGDDYLLDDFAHEQNLVITEDDKYFLLAGCAHLGIINIVDRFYELYKQYPNYIFGGYHLYNRKTDISESDYSILRIGDFLKTTYSICYTGHCTGKYAYNLLKEKLEKQMNYMYTGSVIKT